MNRADVEAHAAACRVALMEGRARPRWTGGSLEGVDLRGVDLHYADFRDTCLSGADLRDADLRDTRLAGADLRDADLRDADLCDADLTGADLRDTDLRGADLHDADLTGADLTGALLDEGVATGRAIGGHVGGYVWWAVALEGGGAVLQYGCERHSLTWWLAQGPELSVHHGHPVEHWQKGPAVAIEAARALGQALPPVCPRVSLPRVLEVWASEVRKQES